MGADWIVILVIGVLLFGLMSLGHPRSRRFYSSSYGRARRYTSTRSRRSRRY